MKKIFGAIVAMGMAAVILSACSSSQKAPTANSQKRAAMGTWVLNNISFEGVPSDLRVTTVLNGIPYKCLQGSVWTLPGNYYGTYTTSVSDQGCQPGTQRIVWGTINQNGVIMLQFKEIYEGEKPKNVTEGFRVELTSVDGNSMVWRAPFAAGNQTAYVVYQFSKR
ncbi:lipocalin-like protein [Chitinophaga skermanii]|uniref:Lipocalin-like protein n=1 Tax=Chitinophaga skermanii TaxID=331697 RepID=A0A327R3B6_9BACT|nr:lipocalin family protein [Chitinophaga skermanii]RAJ10548.1 lipocalin-like protein [Chitinophaga skermanii]